MISHARQPPTRQTSAAYCSRRRTPPPARTTEVGGPPSFPTSPATGAQAGEHAPAKVRGTAG